MEVQLIPALCMIYSDCVFGFFSFTAYFTLEKQVIV